jgi:hypothetical protein
MVLTLANSSFTTSTGAMAMTATVAADPPFDESELNVIRIVSSGNSQTIVHQLLTTNLPNK